MPITAARPIVEQIAVELYKRLQKLEAGSSTSTKVAEVIRPKRLGGWTPKHLQIVLTQGVPELNDELSYPGNPPAIAYDQIFRIHCHVMPSELDPISVDEYINVMVADVQKEVTSPSLWHTFGGLAFNANFELAEQIDSDGSFDGATLPLRVSYRVSENDPYTQR